MRKVEKLEVKYIGYSKPETMEELNLEILGLKTVIAMAKQRISVLHQSASLQHMLGEATKKEPSNEETVEKATEPDKAE